MKHSPGFLRVVEDAKRRIREVSVMEVNNLIDVREESEWAKGHLPGALHLSKGIIERDIEETIADHGARIVLYCGGGFRSALAADSLQKMGYENVESMIGGWRAWTEAMLPTTRR